MFSPLVAIAAFVLLLFVWLYILTVESISTHWIVYIEVTLNMVFLVALLRWASDPLRQFLSLFAFARWVNRWMGTVVPNIDPQKNANHLKFLSWYETIFEWVAMKVNDFVKSIVPVFALVMVTTFAITVIGYGLEPIRITPFAHI